MNLDITPQQLRRAADLKERIEALQAKLLALVGSPTPITKDRNTAAVRWANAPGNGEHNPKRRMSAAAKARLAAVARARWRKAKAAGKNAL
jgi:hypothetical protein